MLGVCRYKSFGKLAWIHVGRIFEDGLLISRDCRINIFPSQIAHQIGISKLDFIYGKQVLSKGGRVCRECSAKLIGTHNIKEFGRKICLNIWKRAIRRQCPAESCLKVIESDKENTIYQNLSRRFIDHLNDWIFVGVDNLKNICFRVSGIIPIPKIRRLGQAIGHAIIHLVAYDDLLIICKWNLNEHIEPVAYDLRNDWIKNVCFPVDDVRNCQNSKYVLLARRKSRHVWQICSNARREARYRNACFLRSPRIIRERLHRIDHALSAKPNHHVLAVFWQFGRLPFRWFLNKSNRAPNQVCNQS